MGEFASKGIAGTGLGLGIAGTALGLMNNGGCCGNGGLLGGLFGNRGNECCYETKEASCLRAENATLKGERYTDGAVLDLYKATVQANNALEAELKAGQKEAFQELVVTRERLATADANFQCLASKLGEVTVNVNRLNGEVAAAAVREASTQGEIKCLATNTAMRFDAMHNETSAAITAVATSLSKEISCCCDKAMAAIALEAEHRACGDSSLKCYVDGTFVPGKLIMPLSSICPPAQPATTTPPSSGATA